MAVDVLGNNYQAFQLIALGKYNHGDVVMSGEGNARGLSKINNHHFFTPLNNKRPTAAQNNEVRIALYNAIVGKEGGSGLTEAQLGEIRAKLGLKMEADQVAIDGERNVGNTPLSRRTIKQIVSFVNAANTAKAEYGSEETRSAVGAMIDQTNLPEDQKGILRENLLGENGQLQQLEKDCQTLLTTKFKTLSSKLADNENPFLFEPGSSVSVAKKACQKFVAQFVNFYNTAIGKIGERVQAQQPELGNNLNVQEQALNDIEIGEDQKQEIREDITAARNSVNEFETTLKLELNEKLANLTSTQLVDERSSVALADSFVSGKAGEIRNGITNQLSNISTKVNNLRHSAEEQLKTGRTEIAGLFDKATVEITVMQSTIESIEDDGARLSQHERDDEKLDGDAIMAALKDIKDIHQKAVDAKNALSETYTNENGQYTAANVGEKKAAFQTQLEKIAADEKQAIGEKLQELNGKLKYTEIALPGGDPAQAAEHTQTKRAALTMTLKAEWKMAADSLKNLATAAEKGFAGISKYLTEAQKQEFQQQLDAIKDRFSEANSKTYVEQHPVGGASPKDMLQKAMADLVKLQDNASKLNQAQCQRSAQEKLDLIGKWSAGDPQAMKTFLADFDQLAGTEFGAQLGRIEDEDKTNAFTRNIQLLISGQQESLNHLADGFRQGKVSAENIHEDIASKMSTVVEFCKGEKFMERALAADAKFAQLTAGLKKEALVGNADDIVKTLGMKDKAEATKIAKTLIARNSKEFDRMMSGFQVRFDSMMVQGSGSDAEFKKLADELVSDFKEAVKARTLREKHMQILARRQSEIVNVEGYKDNPKLAQENEALLRIFAAFSADDDSGNTGKLLTSEVLEKLPTNRGIMGNYNAAECEKRINEGARKASVTRENITLTDKPKVQVQLGKAPEAPQMTQGIDGRVAVGVTGEERPLPQIKKIIVADN